ncbi:hypothetical protein PAPHI01_2328 [Pancytospora philotis]|nr:hypothetical protein PAPHI01_2328 [Pancytospora philotis]
MGIILVASIFAQLSCASRVADGMAAPIRSTFASSMLFLEEAGILRPAAEDGSRADGRMAEKSPVWSHPFLQRLDSMLWDMHRQFERIRSDSIGVATTVPRTASYDDFDYLEMAEGFPAYAGAAGNRCSICSLNESNKAVFEDLLCTVIDDLRDGYADLLCAEGAERMGGVKASARILTLLSAFASVDKSPPNIDATCSADSLDFSQANISGGADLSRFKSGLMHLLGTCKILCDSARDYQHSYDRMRRSCFISTTEAQNRAFCAERHRCIKRMKEALMREIDHMLSKLKDGMGALADLNLEIGACRQNALRPLIEF